MGLNLAEMQGREGIIFILFVLYCRVLLEAVFSVFIHHRILHLSSVCGTPDY